MIHWSYSTAENEKNVEIKISLREEKTYFLSSCIQKAKYQGAGKDQNISLTETKTNIYRKKCQLKVAGYDGSKLS